MLISDWQTFLHIYNMRSKVYKMHAIPSVLFYFNPNYKHLIKRC